MYLRSSRIGVPSFYVVFKREFFLTFSEVFHEFVEENPSMQGVGESLNEDAVLLSVKLNATFLVFVHPDGSVWLTYPLIFLKYAQKHGLKRTQLRTFFYKKQDGTSDLVETRETTLSVPRALLAEEAFK